MHLNGTLTPEKAKHRVMYWGKATTRHCPQPQSDSSKWVQKRGVAFLNVIVAGFCFLLLATALYQFLLRLSSVRGSRW